MFTIDSKVLCKLGQIHDFVTFYFDTLSMPYDLLNWKIFIFCFQCLLIGQQYGVKLFRWNSVFSGIVKCRTVIPYSWIVQLTGIHWAQTITVSVNKDNQSIFVSLFLNIDRRKLVVTHRQIRCLRRKQNIDYWNASVNGNSTGLYWYLYQHKWHGNIRYAMRLPYKIEICWVKIVPLQPIRIAVNLEKCHRICYLVSGLRASSGAFWLHRILPKRFEIEWKFQHR